jgi:ABC-2 type transport system permease protein
MFRSNVILAVWKRNVASYFSGALGYLFIAVFVVAASMLAFNERFFVENQANLDQLSAQFPWLLLFIVPAVTMTLWADERKQGTDELLFTLPANDWEILAGKYLAGLSIYTVALVFSSTIVLVLAYCGSPDVSQLFATYLGYWIAGAALLAAGMFASVLTSSATVAFILGVLFTAMPVALEWVGLDRMFNNQGVRESVSVPGNLRDFTIGVVPLGSVVYFCALAAFFLYLNAVMIARRHWAGGKNARSLGWQFVVRSISLALILLSGTYVLALFSGRLDFTSERLYTLAPATRNAIAKIEKDKPVLMQAYVSPDVPEELITVRKNLLALLKEFAQLGRGKIDVRIVDTAPFSKQSEEATTAGIERRRTQSERGGRVTEMDVYLGVAVSSGYDRVVIPYFEKGTPVEFELTRALGTVAREKRPTVGILKSEARVFGGMDMRSFRQSPEWRLVTDLKKQYVVKEIDPAQEINEGACDVLITVIPSALTEPEMKNLVAAVKRGQPTLIFDDPIPYFVDQSLELVPSNPRKPSAGGGGMFGMGQQPGEPKADGGEALSLTDALGISWDVRDVVFDFHNPHPEFGDRFYPPMIFVTAPPIDLATSERERMFYEGSGLSQRSLITRGLQEMIVWFGGEIRQKTEAEAKFDFTPLISTNRGTSGVMDFDKLVVGAGGFPFGGGKQLNPQASRLEKPDQRQHIVAAQVKSKDFKKGDGVNAIFVADVDFVNDIMFTVSEQQLMGLKIDNVPFVMNCVDMLVGNEDYVSLRNRRPVQRTLTRLEQEQKDFVTRAQEKIVEANQKAEEEINKARKRLVDEVAKVQNDKSLSDAVKQQRLSEAQEIEQRRVSLEEKRIRREAEDEVIKAKREAEERKNAIETRVKLFAWALPPIPAIILGVIMFGRRRLQERRSVVGERLVKKDD